MEVPVAASTVAGVSINTVLWECVHLRRPHNTRQHGTHDGSGEAEAILQPHSHDPLSLRRYSKLQLTSVAVAESAPRICYPCFTARMHAPTWRASRPQADRHTFAAPDGEPYALLRLNQHASSSSPTRAPHSERTTPSLNPVQAPSQSAPLPFMAIQLGQQAPRPHDCATSCRGPRNLLQGNPQRGLVPATEDARASGVRLHCLKRGPVVSPSPAFLAGEGGGEGSSSLTRAARRTIARQPVKDVPSPFILSRQQCGRGQRAFARGDPS